MLEQLIELDQELFLFLNGLGTSTWDGFWLFYTDKIHWIPLYMVLLYLIYKKINNIKLFGIMLVLIVLMITFTDQVTNIFKKVLVMRLRPCYEDGVADSMRLVRSWCGGRYGYFSGHASNSMAVAVFTGLTLRTKYKYLIFILLFWAFVMAYSRIYVGVHYPLDIVSGMAFGALSGFGFYKLNMYIKRRLML